ncbi:MAG: hypothetical protein ACRC0R_02620 [Cetobacterium sp.]
MKKLVYLDKNIYSVSELLSIAESFTRLMANKVIEVSCNICNVVIRFIEEIDINKLNMILSGIGVEYKSMEIGLNYKDIYLYGINKGLDYFYTWSLNDEMSAKAVYERILNNSTSSAPGVGITMGFKFYLRDSLVIVHPNEVYSKENLNLLNMYLIRLIGNLAWN